MGDSTGKKYCEKFWSVEVKIQELLGKSAYYSINFGGTKDFSQTRQVT